MKPEELERALSVRDLTDPAQGPHASQLVVDALTGNLCSAWGSELILVRESPVVSVEDNYENLGYPPDAVTRDARYTRYVDDRRVLRGHTSAMIPGALRRLAAGGDSSPPDVLIATPGVCYRRDSVDWQHTGTPQQVDLWRLTRKRPMDDRDMTEMIGLVVAAVLPGARWRTIAKVHPYTQNGRQVDVWWEGHWVEVGECGLAGPDVLARAGLPTTGDGRWSGLAMGLGVDRLLMLRKGIPDIRLLRSTDTRVASQLLDLEPYRPVSHMPPVRRDLSIVVAPDTDTEAEALGHRVREALGPDADAVETVELRTETAYEELPAAARDRLGIAPGERNLLVRLVLRALDRTLTDAEANQLRDQVYAALHEGSTYEWATVPSG